MGIVYRGFDPIIGRTVALKTLKIDPADAQAKEFRDRLYREAAAAGALSHPNIVTIFDIVEDAGITAVAMEFIEGRSLAAIIAERAPLPVDLAVEILDQVCSALDYAGSQGIVHRDIKPANILVTAAGRAKVTDFGVARLALSTMTQAGTVLGSPSYMSPEQVKGLSLDGRSDLFSAAVVFFEMITRERPFAGNDIATTMYRIAHEPPTPPTRFNPAVGPEIAAVLERAFAKSPADRFQTGADLVAGLRATAPLGSTRGSAQALAALATAPPPVPPIVAPILDNPVVSGLGGGGVRATDAQVSAVELAAPPLTGSGAQALAPIPGTGMPASDAVASVAASGVELPPIPLPPEAGGPPAPKAVVPPAPKAVVPPRQAPGRSRSRGRIVAGVAGVAVVALGIAGAVYLRGGAGPPRGVPAAADRELAPASPADSSLPAEPLPSVVLTPPFAQTPPPPAPMPESGRLGGGQRPPGAPARAATIPQSKPAARPQQPPPAAPAVAAPPPAQAPAAQEDPAAVRIYQAPEVDVRPEVLTQVAPVYPDDAAKNNVQDVVVLQVLVDATGRPQNIRVLRGSQKAPLLDGAAAAAVRQWTFRPARKGGQPVPCWFNIGIPFPPVR